MPWCRAWYNLHILEISLFVQLCPVKSDTVGESIYTLHWLRWNVYSLTLKPTIQVIDDIVELFESRIDLLQKAWRFFRCCRVNVSQQPWQERLNCLGGVRAPSDKEGKCRSPCSPLQELNFSSGSCPITMDNGVSMSLSPWLGHPPECH